MRFALVLLLYILAFANAAVFFKDELSGDWKSRWVVSDNKKDENAAGKWDVSAGTKYVTDAEASKGLMTTEDLRFYTISSKFDKDYDSRGKTLVLQFSVKHPQGIDCGGGYVKVIPAGLNQNSFNGDSQYNIMFGPDICGSTRRIHAIFNHNGENKLMNKDVPCETDKLTHLYTLIVNGADRTYEIRVDGKKRDSGKLEDSWNFLPPRKIKDPNVTKPKDWVDNPQMDDPSDLKPADWDSIPAEIPDPEAKKPDEWDDENDGEWEAPKVQNPAYKGPWKPKKIPNPDYKGPWEHPLIDNPNFKDDLNIAQFESNAFMGIEIWQVKSGSIFDNFLVTDDISLADEEASKVISIIEAEKELVKSEEAKAAEEAKKASEEYERTKKEAEGNQDYDGYDPLDHEKDEL